MGTLLKNALIVTQNAAKDILKDDILIEDTLIQQIEKNIPENNHRVHDMSGHVIIPGFVQAHVHICQTLFRNLADDLELLDWLEKRIWPMEMAHDRDSLRASAQLGLAELLLGGTTCILDMGNGEHQDVIFEEMIRSGIRGLSGKVLMDSGTQPYKDETGAALKESERLIKKWHGAENQRIQYALAPRFVPACSMELWEGVKDLSQKYNLIIHTHASENQKEWQYVKDTTGYSNVEFFEKNGMSSPNLCLAHCIWISEDEIRMMGETGINVLHCPSANLKLGSGIAPIPELLQQGVNVALGADGVACNNNLDMFTEIRLAALIQKPRAGVRSTSAEKIFDMATIGGAKAVGKHDRIGSLETGKKADLTVLNLNKVHCIPADNIYSQIVYSAHVSDIDHVMVDGNWVVFNKELKNYSTTDIMKNAWKEIHKLFERLT
ncbi:MAG TPA: 5'-deoxyadenosine deaminase [Caldithrix sp.]|nr:5'-deoxyadenosine deaminase [Caldithrix sp.]